MFENGAFCHRGRGIFLPVVLYTGALAINGIFDIESLTHLSEVQALWMTVWALGLFGSIYAVFGGLKAVAFSDTINGIGLLLGGLIIPWLGLKACGDGNLFQGINNLIAAHPELSKYLSIGKQITVCYKGRCYEITPKEEG